MREYAVFEFVDGYHAQVEARSYSDAVLVGAEEFCEPLPYTLHVGRLDWQTPLDWAEHAHAHNLLDNVNDAMFDKGLEDINLHEEVSDTKKAILQADVQAALARCLEDVRDFYMVDKEVSFEVIIQDREMTVIRNLDDGRLYRD